LVEFEVTYFLGTAASARCVRRIAIRSDVAQLKVSKVSTGSGSDRVSFSVDETECHPVATAPGTDLIYCRCSPG